MHHFDTDIEIDLVITTPWKNIFGASLIYFVVSILFSAIYAIVLLNQPGWESALKQQKYPIIFGGIGYVVGIAPLVIGAAYLSRWNSLRRYESCFIYSLICVCWPSILVLNSIRIPYPTLTTVFLLSFPLVSMVVCWAFSRHSTIPVTTQRIDEQSVPR